MDPKKASRWLCEESGRWVREGLISDEQAAAIRDLYPAPEPTRPWAVIIFSGLGAVIVGLGVILLFAYNWAAMPKAAKLAVVFLALIALHGSGIWLYLKSPRMKAVGESLTVAGTMFLGAGIWLVAQIYHIQEHFPTAFLVWGMGALLLAWALPSVFQAAMAAILFAVWAGTEAAEFDTAMHLAMPLLLGALLPLAYRERSRILLTVILLAGGITMVFLTGVSMDEEGVFVGLIAYAVLAIGAGAVHRTTDRRPELGTVYHLVGMITYVFFLYLLSFGEIADEVLEPDLPDSLAGMIYWGLPPLMAAWAWIATAAFSVRLSPEERRDRIPFDLWLVPGALVVAYLFALLPWSRDEWVMAGPFNLILLAHCASLMARGVRTRSLKQVVYGALLLIALAGARYVDLLQSLMVRGLVFLVVGGVLFAEGIFYARGNRLDEEAE